MTGLVEIFENRNFGRFLNAQHQRAAADAVDPENQVKQRTQYRHQPNNANPECRRADVTFV